MGNINSINSKLHFQIISDKTNATKLLESAEKDDFYLADCLDDEKNSLARRNLTYSPNIIGLNDLKHALTYLDGNLSGLPMRFHMDLEKIHIIQLMPTADGGMPHTRPGNIICYPSIAQLFSKTTLLHELWHIHQRNFKKLWEDTFKQLGWIEWNGILPEKLENNRRYNPDTIDAPLYIYDNTWIPVPIFRNITHPNVGEVDIWFYNPEKGYHITHVPPEIESYFPNLPAAAYEHPREITAYLLSEPSKYSMYACFKNLIVSIGEISIMTSDNKSIY